MQKKRYLWEHIIEQPTYATEAALYQSIVEIIGDRRVLIENHQGIITYGREKIVVKVRFGSVSICGYSLEIAQMTKEQLVIFGNIQTVSLHRREKS